ncbi:MAG: AI-2E family transporter, partial [Bacillota bacterium]|nr:AI-2E family transporter [Bacillota bacterium]
MINFKKKVLIFTPIILLIVLLGIFLYSNKDKIIQIVIPFFIAIIIAYSLKPLVIKLESKNMPRSVSIILIYLVFTLGMVVATIFIIPELMGNTKELMDTLPDLTNKYQKLFNGYISHIQSSKWSPEIKGAILR